MSSTAPAGLQVVVSLTRQRLVLDRDGTVVAEFPVSTSRHGPGERRGSLCTPRGRHVIRARIGAGLPEGAVFRARRPTGEVWSEALDRRFPGRDWILTRILWLSGCEPGRNRLRDVDSMARYIYIHGTPPTEPMGVPQSHGCIRMRNADVVRLFELVPAGTPVLIGD
jgi:lipoprotein-anchoring transpeptidase ErfK/SrfK